MKVYFHEIKEQDLDYRFDENTPWIMEVIGALDERIDRIQRPPNWKPRSRPTEVTFTLRRVDDLVHVTGKVKTQLYLLCSLCADAFQFPIQTQFHVLLTQTPIYAETPRESSRKNVYEADAGEAVWEDDEDDGDDDVPALNLNAADFEVSVVSEPLADLKEILNEQIILTLPMQPKPPQNEKGDCTKCGRNQLAYQPEHQEELKENPFSVLKNLKKKSEN
ncbi:MAG: hypothetical protein EBX52_01840 [Proteobacteria bacterium]|nr:hypothetical protein [Pseudomonadota bacterium]